MAVPASVAMDAMTQLVLAGEGGLMAAMVAIENDETLAAALAAANVSALGTPAIRSDVSGIRQDESTSLEISLGEARQGEPSSSQITLPPQLSKRPFESPLYRRGYKIDPTTNMVMELGSSNKIVVQVNDKTLNAWARSLVRKDDGRFYFVSPTRTRWFQGVNTWIPVDLVQKYMRDVASFPRNDQKQQSILNGPLSTPRFRSVMDYVATLRAACSSPGAAFL